MQAVGLFVQIILARLLAPEDFGTIAIVLSFINIAQVFVQSGLNTSLIQKKAADKIDFSTVFYASLLIAAIFYLLIFFAAPTIATFYENPALVRILRTLSLILFPGDLSSVQQAFISRKMLFKKSFRISMVSSLISGVAGILAAFFGLGVWALVVYYLVSYISSTTIMIFTVKWRPSLVFSFKRLKSLFSFGGKLLISSLIHTLYMDLRTLIIGKLYDSDILGYYNRGENVPKTVANAVNGAIQAVMLPTLSSIQDEKNVLKRVVRRSIKTTSFLVFPVMMGLAAVAEPFVSLVLGDKWLPAVPFLRVFCAASAFHMIHSANYQGISALGRGDIYLKIEIIKKIVGLIILAISIPFGIYAIAVGYAVSAIIESFIHMLPNKGLYGYSISEQIKDILPSLTLSIVMGVVVYLIGFIDLPSWQLLLIQIPAGVLIYIGISMIFKLESLSYLKSTLSELFGSRHEKKI